MGFASMERQTTGPSVILAGSSILFCYIKTMIYSFNEKVRGCAGTTAVVLRRGYEPEFLVAGLLPQGVRSGLLVRLALSHSDTNMTGHQIA